MGNGKLRGRTEGAKGNTVRPMKRMLTTTTNIKREVAYGWSCA